MTADRTQRVAPDQQMLKAASRELIRAVGGQEAAAEFLGSRQQRMSDCGRPNTPDFLRLDEIARLEDVTHGDPGHPHITAALARRQGYAIVRLPDAPPAGRDLLSILAENARENGDVASAILSAIGDGKVDGPERRAILGQIDEQIHVAMRLRSTIAALPEGGHIA